jgi:methionyl-tRNA formyltransferase
VVYARKITSVDRRMTCEDAALEARRIRIGGAFLSVAGQRLRVLEGIATDTALPARTITLHDERVMLGCVTGSVVCEKVQPEGRSAMEAVAWWRGHRGPDTLVVDDD